MSMYLVHTFTQHRNSFAMFSVHLFTKTEVRSTGNVEIHHGNRWHALEFDCWIDFQLQWIVIDDVENVVRKIVNRLLQCDAWWQYDDFKKGTKHRLVYGELRFYLGVLCG